ncbi:hypothetical protein AVEN_153170-1 [Araneus ventricosus]|uniref:Uncharacterized protein n=1 Tax=Araneus ventricosus TaxID=182803 RepID=A0A4Y2L9J8_ARAVE|nr:hypothetical protein AVEN_153170-1 [Araneus ventricosus]
MQLLNLGLIEFVNKQEPVLDAEATKADKQNFELRKAKTLSTICLSIDENLKSIVYNIDSPVAALQEIENVFGTHEQSKNWSSEDKVFEHSVSSIRYYEQLYRKNLPSCKRS